MTLLNELPAGQRFKAAGRIYVLLRNAEGSSLVRTEDKREIVIGGKVVYSVNERPYRIASTTQVDEVLDKLDVRKEVAAIYSGEREEDTTEKDAEKALKVEARKKKAREK